MDEVKLGKEFWSNKNIKMVKNDSEKGYNLIFPDDNPPMYISYIDKVPFKFNEKYISVNFNATTTERLSTQLFVLGYKDKNKILTEIIDIKYSKLIDISKVDEIRFMIRVKGSGSLNVDCISIDAIKDTEGNIKYSGENTNEKYLVLTNVYPSHTDLYRNGFVHRRVRSYVEKGIKVDVFSMKGKGAVCKYEYDESNVFEGNKEALTSFLKNSNYKKILIHFVDKDMYEAIQKTVPNTKLIIWIHGVETEKWYRRMFNITNEKEAEIAISKLEDNYKRLRFMNEIYSRKDNNIKFIFVSKWFKEEVAEIDAKAKVIANNYDIIHNIVDTELFKFKPKNIEQRYKILTIRPFASRKYANDLSVKAILELTKKDYFDKLDIAIYGEGRLFEETLEPLKKFSNVKINQTFLKQEEISKLHKEYGIFLCPTRLDSQGVSMCEAMSSGLVPITCGVTAIPEFVTHNCGMLAIGEDYSMLAKDIDYLIANPTKFSEISANASRRMEEICSKNNVISKEMKIILE